MAILSRMTCRAVLLGGTLFVLAACDQPMDFDFRNSGFNSNGDDRQATSSRPQPDDRGVISYPNYQVAIARQGDTISDVAARVGLPAEELSRYNGIPLDATLNKDEVIALPSRVSEPSDATGAITSGPIQPASGNDITSIAGDAIDRAGDQPAATSNTTKPKPQTGKEPIRHKVERGETAYSISRVYNVSVRSLADWNGLGSDMNVREGQFLLIPVAAESAPKPATSTAPGQGSVAPEPPSASTPLPAEKPSAKPKTPPSPDLGSQKTASSDTAKLLMPVNGKITRPYVKDKNDGIDISAPAGTAVKAAAAGTVAAITRDTNQVPIIVLRHPDNLLTVYAGVDNLAVEKGDTVKRGQTIAKIRNSSPAFLHFEVRKGLDSVDPVPFLN